MEDSECHLDRIKSWPREAVFSSELGCSVLQHRPSRDELLSSQDISTLLHPGTSSVTGGGGVVRASLASRKAQKGLAAVWIVKGMKCIERTRLAWG